jgi:hypothetical protein
MQSQTLEVLMYVTIGAIALWMAGLVCFGLCKACGWLWAHRLRGHH